MTIELRLYRRAEVVRRTASAEGDSIVGRALPVDDQPAIVVEGLALCPADRVEERVRQRFGGNHQRVDGRNRAALTRQPGGETLGGTHDDVGGDGTGLAAHLAILELEHTRALVDRH